MNNVVIIGGGITALSTAWECLQRGYKTTIIYKRRSGSSTRAAGGMLCPAGEADGTHESLIEMALQSCTLYPRWIATIEKHARSKCDYRQNGTLLLALHNDHYTELEHLAHFQEQYNLNSKWLSRQDIKNREPNLASRQVGGLLCEDDHNVDPRQLQMALLSALSNNGATIQPVQTLELMIQDNQMSGVRSDSGFHHANQYILSDGAWSSLLFDLPIRPVKGQYLLLQGAPLIQSVIRTPDVYMVPRKNGQLYIGATMEEEGFSEHLTAGSMMDLLYHTFQVLRGIYELKILEHAVGFRPALRDNQPVIGKSSVKDLWLNTAHYRHGIMLAPQAATILCNLLEGAEESIHFSATRFRQ